MTKLIETDEEVEKAGKGMIPRGGTSKLQLKLRSAGKGSPRTRRYLLNRTKGGPIHGEAAGRRRGVYKANEPTALEALDSAIEKARGLMPKGGSLKAWRGLVKRDAANAKNMASGKTSLAAGLRMSGRLKRARSFAAARVGAKK